MAGSHSIAQRPSRAAFRRVMGSDIGGLRYQIALNIRERGDGRKQKPVRRL